MLSRIVVVRVGLTVLILPNAKPRRPAGRQPLVERVKRRGVPSQPGARKDWETRWAVSTACPVTLRFPIWSTSWKTFPLADEPSARDLRSLAHARLSMARRTSVSDAPTIREAQVQTGPEPDCVETYQLLPTCSRAVVDSALS